MSHPRHPLAFPAPEPVLASVDDGRAFPVRRIFAVGKNYAAHAAEMGSPPDADPVFFTKLPDSLSTGGAIGYPAMTENLHFEGELVLALGKGGRDVAEENAAELVFGYAAGCDLTLRDIQAAAKARSGPWDLAKSFAGAAVIGPLVARSESDIESGSLLGTGSLRTVVNGEVRQDGRLEHMRYSPRVIIARLSRYFELTPGDLIYTGTPAGVGPLLPGDDVEVAVDGLPSAVFSIVDRGEAPLR